MPMSARPTGSAAAFHVLGTSRAGRVTNISSSAYSRLGWSMATRKMSGAATARVSSTARFGRGSAPTRAVMRMCSPRWSATTEPSMASQMNRTEASSSDQTMG